MTSDPTREHVLTPDDTCPCGQPQEGSGYCSYECFSKFEMGAAIEPAPSAPVPAVQEGAGATDTAGTETDRGTGERGPHGRSETAAEWIMRTDHTPVIRREFPPATIPHEAMPHLAGFVNALKPFHFREAAASIRAMADADEAAKPPIGCEINYLRGLRRAADLLDSTAKDPEGGE